MKKLHISPKLSLPPAFLELRTVIYGGSGSGKTTAGRVLFEEATAAGVLAGAIDLKSDWWGLKSTADGKGEGIPIVVFGGEHADVPIDPDGGAALAEIIVDLQQPFVVDLEELSKGKQLRFLAAFFDRLYDKNRTPLVLFCDEADRYAPQRPMQPEANFCLGAVEDIAKRGRKHGIFPVFITQRNASLNKNVSELCDTAIVFRTAGPRDQEAVEEWFSTKATREQRDVVMKNLAGMETGEAVVCSAHPSIRLFESARMRLPKTFDSSATPTIGGRAIAAPKKLARPDLKKIQERMAATIERAAAEDPKALRATIQDLKRQLAAKPPAVPVEKVKIQKIEVPLLSKKQVNMLENANRAVQEFSKQLEIALGKSPGVVRVFGGDLKPNVRIHLNPEAVKNISSIPAAEQRGEKTIRDLEVTHQQQRLAGEKPLSSGEKKILTALFHYPAGKTKRQLGVLTGYAHNGGAFNNYVSSLRTRGYITGKDTLQITDEGATAVGPVGPLPTGRALQDYWLGQLGAAERAILQVLIDSYPEQELSKEGVAQRTASFTKDGRPYAANGGGFNNAISRLRTLDLIEGSSDALLASSTLFD